MGNLDTGSSGSTEGAPLWVFLVCFYLLLCICCISAYLIANPGIYPKLELAILIINKLFFGR